MNLQNRYDFFASDITSNCNLRCPFCVNDWLKIRGNEFISHETFQKVITLFPLLPQENSFYFSCLFEPTLHPDFIGLLKMIPPEHRKKVFFTTNLTSELSDETISVLAEIDINHINISLDTFDPVLFENLRRGAKYKTFIDNLERLTEAFSRKANATPLHYITVLGKYNYDEILKIVETCATRYLSSMNEIRTISVLPHMDKKWLDKNTVSYEEYLKLRNDLSNLSFTWTTVFTSLPNKWSTFYPDQTEIDYDNYVNAISDTVKKKIYFVPPYVGLRILSSGIAELLNVGVDVRFNINDMENPYEFFKNILQLHWLDVARAREIKKLVNEKVTLIEKINNLTKH
jgi:molybdenum cofactor biosynthesis enzyme MoaA